MAVADIPWGLETVGLLREDRTLALLAERFTARLGARFAFGRAFARAFGRALARVLLGRDLGFAFRAVARFFIFLVPRDLGRLLERFEAIKDSSLETAT